MYMYRIYRVIIKYCNILCCWSISSTDNYFITPKFKKSLDLPLNIIRRRLIIHTHTNTTTIKEKKKGKTTTLFEVTRLQYIVTNNINFK